MRLRRATVGVVVVLLGAACSSAETPAGRTDLPASIAAAGDSMTRAFNVVESSSWSDAPAYSWATGDRPTIRSHYFRLKQMRPGVREFNVARTGAKMADLGRQVRLAASYKAEYLTILMGANDLLAMLRRDGKTCTVDASRMTPVPTFRSQFRSALEAFTARRPQARIMVSSIPNVPRLWRTFSTSSIVVAVWERTGGCGAVQPSPKTLPALAVADARLAAYNATLASTCKAFKQCRWDGGATFRYHFTRNDFSPVDYFHPSPAGQRLIADVTWRAGYWG